MVPILFVNSYPIGHRAGDTSIDAPIECEKVTVRTWHSAGLETAVAGDTERGRENQPRAGRDHRVLTLRMPHAPAAPGRKLTPGTERLSPAKRTRANTAGQQKPGRAPDAGPKPHLPTKSWEAQGAGETEQRQAEI